MNIRKRCALALRLISKNMAIMACGAASLWGGYQIKDQL